MDLKSYVISAVDPAAYYSALFPNWTPTVRPNVPCPFHDDHDPSLAVGLGGGGARCHAAGCGASLGNVVHFESRRTGVSELDAAAVLYGQYVRNVVPRSVVSNFQDGLRTPAAKRVLHVLLTTHGVTLETLQHFGCGFDLRSGRLVIPVQNAYGLVVNLRFYKPRSLRRPNELTLYNYVENKGTPTERRYGGNELFPWQEFGNFQIDRPLLVVASEKEAMLCYQMGVQAVSSTAGEGSWLAGWSESFVGFPVGILFDPDDGGRKGAGRVVAQLANNNVVALPLTLPFPRGFRGPQDLDDWVVSGGGTGERLLALFAELRNGQGTCDVSVDAGTTHRASVTRTLRRVQSPGRAAVVATAGTTERIAAPPTTQPKVLEDYRDAEGKSHLNLDQIRRTPEALNKAVTSQGLVAGLAQRSFSVPWKFKLIPKQGPPRIHTMTVGRELLSFINAPDEKINKTVLQLCGANSKTVTTPIEFHPVTELELIPLAESAVVSNSDTAYTVQRCFTFGVDVKANVAYELRIVPTTMPQTQETVGVILAAKEINSQQSISLDDKTLARLSQFKPETSQESSAVWAKLELLVREISEHHTYIYERPDWHMAVLLTYFSPLQYIWPLDDSTQRGWINTLAVGDTKTGKSEVTKIIGHELLQAGETVSSESCTYVGLVGGAIKGASGQFMLRWGRIPLCDRKLLVLEELSGLTVDEISNMSDVRSSGIARLDKGGLAGQTPARTRLLCLSNVRSKTKRLADYLSGVKAVSDLVGHAEDISRFDLICTLVDSEVSADVINRASARRTTRPAWALADIRVLLQFCWSLRAEQIKITDEAARRCLELTLELGKDYHSGIPIFKASSDRHKIARIAVAIACLQFNWNTDRVVCETSHMEGAALLLRSLYDKASLGYKEWSKQMFDRDVIRDTDELDEVFGQVQQNERLRGRAAEVLIHAAKFSRDELCACAALTISQADLFLNALLVARAIRKGEANTWEITQPGKRWLESVVSETSQAKRFVSTTKRRVGRNGNATESPVSFSEAFDLSS